jgi:putative chitinase
LSPEAYAAKVAELEKTFGSAVPNLDEIIGKIPKPIGVGGTQNLYEQLQDLANNITTTTQDIINSLSPENIANSILDLCKEVPNVEAEILLDDDGNPVVDLNGEVVVAAPVEKADPPVTPQENPKIEPKPTPPPASGFTFAFTKDKLVAAGGPAAGSWYDAFAATLPKYGITTPDRVAAFVAQIRVESGDFTALKEKLGYSAKPYFSICANRLQLKSIDECGPYLVSQEKVATGLYERAFNSQSIHSAARNLGNTEPGDGFKFIGRGLKQLTGRYNYTRASKDLYGDDRLVKNPDLVSTDKTVALETACWYWQTRNLSAVADSWDITLLSKKVNGGTIGLKERIEFSDQARKIMKA